MSSSFYKFTREAHLEALKLTEIASGIDPEFAAAYALGARCYIQRKAFGWCTDVAQERIEARRLARRAIELDRDDQCNWTQPYAFPESRTYIVDPKISKD